MDNITTMLVQADVLFDLRPVLESIGFDKEVDIFFVFTNKENKNCYETGAIPPSLSERTSSLSSDNLYDSVVAFLNKTVVQFPKFEDEIAKELGTAPKGETEVEIKVVSKKGDIVKQEFVLGWPRLCRPCPNGTRCCWC